MVRGSQVWIDRPRIVLGVLRKRGLTLLGVAKSNIRGVNDYDVLATLARDPDTLMHMPVSSSSTGSEKPAKLADPDTSSAAELDELVMAVLRRMHGEGTRATVSGKKDELWAHKPAELAGVSRDAIRASLRRLIEAGRIIQDGDGLHPVDDVEAPPLAAE